MPTSVAWANGLRTNTACAMSSPLLSVCRLSTKVPWPTSSSRSSTRRTCVPSNEPGMAPTLVRTTVEPEEPSATAAAPRPTCRCPPLG